MPSERSAGAHTAGEAGGEPARGEGRERGPGRPPESALANPEPHRGAPSLRTILREWGRIGCIGFGGPPAHVALFRELWVTRRGWLSDVQFERAVAATNLLPGPSSTQLAIYGGWRLRGPRGAVLAGLAFIVPGLCAVLALSLLFLAGSPPRWVRGAGMGAGAVVPAVALVAGVGIAAPLLARTRSAGAVGRLPLLLYGVAGALAAALTGVWLVLVLLGCGTLELARRGTGGAARHLGAWLPVVPVALSGGLGALAWTALKVGGLSFGGGFVIVPLMQADAVGAHHWMTHGQFLDAVALGQATPGPVVQTVAAVGYAAGGLGAGLLAAAVAFAPSFSFVLIGAARFERLLADGRVRAFLGGAAPAAAGAIVGSAIPLTAALGRAWQYPLLGAGLLALAWRRSAVVPTLLGGGLIGAVAALLGAPVSH